jgi:hypothetical protein
MKSLGWARTTTATAAAVTEESYTAAPFLFIEEVEEDPSEDVFHSFHFFLVLILLSPLNFFSYKNINKLNTKQQ